MGRTERTRELARRRIRSVKLKKLRARFGAAKNEGEKVEIMTKARRLSPFINFDEQVS